MKLPSFLNKLLPASNRQQAGHEQAMFSPAFEAATALPDPGPLKPVTKQSTFPGYRTQVTPSASSIPTSDRRLATTDAMSLRTAQTTKDVVRNFVAANPDLSATVNGYLRVGLPEEYTVIARNLADGIINPEATQLAHALLRRMTFVPDYTQGFTSQQGLTELAASLGKEFMMYGSAAIEVVPDAARIPSQMVAVHTPSIKFYEDKQGLKPVQEIGGKEISLDIPTFIYSSIDQDLKDAYSSSMLESAIQPVLADQQFMNDLRKLMRRAIYPRIAAQIFVDKVKQAAPMEAQNDPEKMSAYMNEVYAAVNNMLTNMEPEDAMVHFDVLEVAYINDQQGDVSANLQAVQDLINAKVATGAKTMPAMLGHGQGGNHASTEALLFVKSANVVRRGVQGLFSRALTIACRMMGQDVYVEFAFAAINLRPEDELEAFKAMRQSNVLDLLSVGMLTDEEACVKLTGNLPPPGMPKLSGTMFRSAKPADSSGNPTSNTSAMEQTLTPGTPQKPKGPAKETKK